MTENHLIVFVKNPILGQVKTRLAHTVGEVMALKVYTYLLFLTKNLCSQIACQKHIYYSDFIPTSDIWDELHPSIAVQDGQTLGERMSNAIQNITLKGNNKCLLIGSDCPYISPDLIHQAFDALDDTIDVVLGPAEDGGYYLIGMKKSYPFLFENIEWSSPNVMRQTLQQARLLQLSCAFMPMLCDIDTEQDWNQYLISNQLQNFNV
jgi:rSAM/selenodomain-associated transferase 1